jgi:hypothetical protein
MTLDEEWSSANYPHGIGGQRPGKAMGQGEHLRPWNPGDDIIARLRRYRHPEMCNVSDMLLHDIEAAVVEIIRLRSGSTTMDKNETRADPDLNI